MVQETGDFYWFERMLTRLGFPNALDLLALEWGVCRQQGRLFWESDVALRRRVFEAMFGPRR